MSLVGTRPPTVDEWEQYELHHRSRISDIMKETGLSRSSVHSYLPYTKVIYNAEELSLYARRCRTYRKRKLAVQKLQSCMP